MDWWTQNKDAITAIGATIAAIITVGGIIWAVVKWGFLRGWQRKLRVEVKVFEAIADPAILLPKLFATENDNSPLADHRITYQPRDPNRDIQAELKAALNRSRYLLITAPTGYGKTREAGMLAQTMMLEGWRALRIKNTGWLDVPKTLPEELGNNRSRVLILLDDLNGLFSTGERTQSPRAEQIPMLNESSYHDRLLQVLDMFEGMCTESEIRVIATARSEREQWQILGFDLKDKLWKRFERIELPEPANSAIINLLDDSVKQANMKANPEEFEAIAHKSDGTYRNILLNLRRWQAQNKEVATNDFTETLDGSWRDVYERAVKKYPEAKYIYNAVYLLQQFQIPLYPYLVKALARKVTNWNIFVRLVYNYKIDKSLKYLIHHENILSPRDGQVNAGINVQDLVPAKYLNKIIEILILPGFFYTNQLETSVFQTVFQFATIVFELPPKTIYTPVLAFIALSLHFPFEIIALYLYNKGYEQKALNILKKRRVYNTFTIGYLSVLYSNQGEAEKAISLLEQSISSTHQSSIILHRELGDRYAEVKRYNEAEAIYRKAIDLNPSEATTYLNLGSLLSNENLKRYDEAEAIYRKAIDLNPSYAKAYYNLGNLLSDENLKRYDEAEAAYRKAIDLNPSYAKAYYNLGNLLSDENLKRYDEAEAAYRKAIELNPSEATTYSNLGSLLDDLKRYDEAEAAYRKAIELNPSYAKAYYNLAILLRIMNKEGEALPVLEKLIEINPEDFDSYLGIASIKKTLGESLESAFIEKARQHIPEDNFYNMACLESVSDNFDLAFVYLGKATQNEKFNSSWAWEDPDLEWIRNDPRFIEIVGPKPEK